MISVIVCSRQASSWDIHERNVRKTVGSPYEYIRVQNQHGQYGLCAAYNQGVSEASGDVLVFVHEDVFFMEPGWGDTVLRKFRQDQTVGLLGVAGTQCLLADNPAWLAAGQPFLRGRLVHETNGGKSFYLSVFSWDQEDADAVAVDGLFFAIRRELFDHIRFDEETFGGFHFYDMDISMQVRRTHRLIVTWDVLVKHLSAGVCDDAWVKAGQKFLSKYRNALPASCVNASLYPGKREFGQNYNLQGVLPQATIC